MGSENRAIMGAQMYGFGWKRLVSYSWDGSNIFKNSKNLKSGSLGKHTALFLDTMVPPKMPYSYRGRSLCLRSHCKHEAHSLPPTRLLFIPPSSRHVVIIASHLQVCMNCTAAAHSNLTFPFPFAFVQPPLCYCLRWNAGNI